jgi:hypothetical protein
MRITILGAGACTELDAAALDSARPAEEVELALQEFCAAPTPEPGSDSEESELVILVTWESRVLRWLRTCRAQIPSVLLKRVWGNVSRVRVGDLATIMEALGIEVPQGPETGRVGRRLMLACAMTHRLRVIRSDDA